MNQRWRSENLEETAIVCRHTTDTYMYCTIHQLDIHTDRQLDERKIYRSRLICRARITVFHQSQNMQCMTRRDSGISRQLCIK